VTIVVCIWCLVLFFFLPETFWARKSSSKSGDDVVLDTEQRNTNIQTLDNVSELHVHIENPSKRNSRIDQNDKAADQGTFIIVESKIVVDNIEAIDIQDTKAELQPDFEKNATLPSEILQDPNSYTERLRRAPPRSFAATLRPYNGRIREDNWLKVAVRPFILFAYPAVLWSALVYSLSVGWLIVLSESIDKIYRNPVYDFTSMETGLVYLSPFIGAVLGSAIAGKMSDIICTFMAKRNDGVFEPEFRLVMAPIIALSTTIGLIGFGWSAYVHDQWMVPTFFFGVVSFGCSLGSTTAITYCVDSYKEYSGEALVTLNFSKSKFHAGRSLPYILNDN
jgi:Major Facilitator Superfamily